MPDSTCLDPEFATIINPDAKDNFYMATIMLFHVQQKYNRPTLLAGLCIMVYLFVEELVGCYLLVTTCQAKQCHNSECAMDNINHTCGLHLCGIIILCDNLSVATFCWLVYYIIEPYIRPWLHLSTSFPIFN